MADEQKGIRLKKAATELNVGISTLVEFLAKKGHQVEINPNTRLTAEQYSIVATAFQGERAVKEQADKIEITPSGNNVTIEANSEEPQEEAEEVIIKNYNHTTAIDNKGAKQPAEPAVTPDEPAEEAPVEKSTETVDVVAEPEPAAPEFITSVGDDSISRFDAPKRKKQHGRGKRNKNRRRDDTGKKEN